MGDTVLIVDDELAIRQMLRFALGGEGYLCREAGTAAEADEAIASVPPDLILLDWMLPGVSGLDLARRLRRDPKTREIPIIMLSARGEEGDRIRGLETGADDYVTKPFSTRELLARVKAVLRRSRFSGGAGLYCADGLVMDPQAHRVTARGEAVALSPTEFRLLEFLMAHPERVFTRSQLLDQVWGERALVEERTVDVHVRRLRKALSGRGYDRFIQTVRSVGYRFSAA